MKGGGGVCEQVVSCVCGCAVGGEGGQFIEGNVSIFS